MTCEPVDVAIAKRHLHITYSAIRHSDKPFMGPVGARARRGCGAHAKMVFGDDLVEQALS